jgi:hypothetical protein
MLNNDIDELFIDVEEILATLETEKQKAIGNKEKIKLSSAKIKSLLAHLRDVFDYTAKDIYNLLRQKYSIDKRQVKEVDILYFPIRDTQSNFKAAIYKDYRYIEEYFPEVFNLIESIQPFEKKDNWLLKLNKLNKRNKHSGLSEQNRAEYTNVTVGASGGVILIPPTEGSFQVGSVNLQGKEALMNPIRFENGKVMNPDTLPLDSKIGEITEFRWNGDYHDLVYELKLIYNNTKQFKESFYKLIADR